jgi:hypothetical protein
MTSEQVNSRAVDRSGTVVPLLYFLLLAKNSPKGIFIRRRRTSFTRRRRALLPGINNLEIPCLFRFSKISLFLSQLYGQEILRYVTA